MLKARLSNDRRRVICGVRDIRNPDRGCGATLALVLDIVYLPFTDVRPTGDERIGEWVRGVRPLDDDEQYRAIFLPPGWGIRYCPGPRGSLGPDNAVWDFTERRIEAMPTPRSKPAGIFGKGWGDAVTGWLPYLPADIVCRARRCGQRQRLDPKTLGIVRNPSPQAGVDYPQFGYPCRENRCIRRAVGGTDYCEEHGQGKVATRTPEPGVLFPLEDGSPYLWQYEEWLRLLRA